MNKIINEHSCPSTSYLSNMIKEMLFMNFSFRRKQIFRSCISILDCMLFCSFQPLLYATKTCGDSQRQMKRHKTRRLLKFSRISTINLEKFHLLSQSMQINRFNTYQSMLVQKCIYKTHQNFIQRNYTRHCPSVVSVF